MIFSHAKKISAANEIMRRNGHKPDDAIGFFLDHRLVKSQDRIIGTIQIPDKLFGKPAVFYAAGCKPLMEGIHKGIQKKHPFRKIGFYPLSRLSFEVEGIIADVDRFRSDFK